MELRSKFETPILFLIFNRPETTFTVFEEIAKLQPRKLYIAADGPRAQAEGEKEKCFQARSVIQKINWPCDVKTLFRDENLGCKNAVSSAITWFFQNETEGIILEDDCVPSESFFYFCRSLLETYRDNEQVMHIGGNNFHRTSYDSASYYFTNYNHVWGWATWRRAWKRYDKSINDFPEFLQENRIDRILGERPIKYSWLYKFWKSYSNKIDTWDYQWTYSIWNNNGISITPAKNLVSNIGFNQDATHTKSNGKNWTLTADSIDIIIHPREFDINHGADKREDKIAYNGSNIKNLVFWLIICSLRLKLKKQ